MVTFLIIYLIGYVASYVMFKIVRVYFPDEDAGTTEWDNIFMVLKMSFLSWIAFFLAVGYIISQLIQKYDPPKWL